MIERYNNESFYYGIYYDKYRDLYIRTAKISTIAKDEEGLIDPNNFKYSIMILNNKFEIISEQLFYNKEYSVLSFGITRDGIMLQRPDDLSGTTRYTLFTYNNELLK